MKPTKKIIDKAHADLAAAYTQYSIAQLRWDWMCNIQPDSRDILRRELDRRGITPEEFESYGRGKP